MGQPGDGSPPRLQSVSRVAAAADPSGIPAADSSGGSGRLRPDRPDGDPPRKQAPHPRRRAGHPCKAADRKRRGSRQAPARPSPSKGRRSSLRTPEMCASRPLHGSEPPKLDVVRHRESPRPRPPAIRLPGRDGGEATGKPRPEFEQDVKHRHPVGRNRRCLLAWHGVSADPGIQTFATRQLPCRFI